MKLTDRQLIILSSAAQREDHGIELPPDLEQATAEKLVDKLAGAGLIEEVEKSGTLPIWRRVDDVAFALRITTTGLQAIGVAEGEDAAVPVVKPKSSKSENTANPKPTKKQTGRTKKEANKAVRKAEKPSKPKHPAGPRGGSKLDQVKHLLMRKRGATIKELMEATGWLPHTSRAVLTGFRKRGFAIEREAVKGKPTTYRIVNDGTKLQPGKRASKAA
jgi:hypothetical protein